MDESLIKLIIRIKNTHDGKDFVDYLLQCSADNYKQWKQEGGDLLRGKAIAFDQIVSLFETIDEKAQNVATNPEWL